MSAAEVLIACPPEAMSMSVCDLLMSQRRWGTTRCRKFLARNQIVETKPIGKLTERQRLVLARALQERVEPPRIEPSVTAVQHDRELAFA